MKDWRKIRPFFIDEFQDTSEMQWNNLSPLMSDSLSSCSHSSESSHFYWSETQNKQSTDGAGAKSNNLLISVIISIPFLLMLTFRL